MSIETRLADIEAKLNVLNVMDSVSSSGWDVADLPDWPVEEFYNYETKSIIIKFTEKNTTSFYRSTVINSDDILRSPGSTYKHRAIWLRRGNANPLPSDPRPKPFTKDDERIANGKLPFDSWVILADVQDFKEKSVHSEENASFKTDSPIHDKYNEFEKIIPGENNTGIYFGKDGTILLKGPGSEMCLGPGTISYGSVIQRNSTNEIEGGIMQTNPLRFLPSFCVLPIMAMIPNIQLALKAASISGTIVDASKIAKKMKEVINA